MNKPFSIAPSPELVEQWLTEFYGATMEPGEATMDLAARAAQWGADQELVAPTDEKLLEIATQQWGSFHGSAQWPGAEHVVEVSRSDLVSFARAILAKWGPR